MRFRDYPLQKKMTALFMLLVMIPCVLLSTILYRLTGERHRREWTAQQEATLQSMERNIAARMAQIESIVEVLTHSDAVTHLLTERSQSRGDTILDLLYGARVEVLRSEMYLAKYGADILLVSMREGVPDRYDTVLNHAAYGGDEAYHAFLLGEERGAWGPPRKMLPDLLQPFATNDVAMIPYYSKVLTGISTQLGTVLCGVRIESLLEPLMGWADGPVITVWYGDTCVFWSDGQTYRVMPTGVEHGVAAGRFRSSLQMRDVGYTLTLDADAHELQAQLLITALNTLLITAFGGTLMLAVTRILVRMVLRSLRQSVQAMEQFNTDNRHVQLPVESNDEIGQMIGVFNQLLRRIDGQYDQLLQKEQDQRRLHLLALQYQLNPHFLFNSLHWLQMQMEACAINPTLCESIESLGQVLRYNLSESRSATLHQEAQHMHAYIAFMQSMKQNQIELTMDWPESLDTLEILRFTFQPILENVIRHGLIPNQTLHIGIYIRLEPDHVHIRVENDGKPISPENLAQIQHRLAQRDLNAQQARGVGLSNLALRLRLVYGDKVRMIIDSTTQGTTQEIFIPLDEDIRSLYTIIA